MPHNRTTSLDTIINLLPQARKYGNYVMGLCPFHDDHSPSLMAFEDGWFRCLSCGVSGKLDKLERKLQGRDASRSLKETTNWHPPYLPTDLQLLRLMAEGAHDALRQYEQFQWYIDQRGLHDRIEPNRIGWWNGWYTLPVYAQTGGFQGLVLRAGSHIQKATGVRFHQPAKQKPMMYCPDWHLLSNAKRVAVVFGMFDALTLADLRFPAVTSTLGKDTFDADWLYELRKPIVILPDKGEEVTAGKLAAHLGWRGKVVRLDYPEDCKDTNDFLRTNRRSQLVSQLTGIL